ncbi:DUF3987 domain-containing protein [Aeromonas enteropelogenes]|uniref:DUF3987 domain-containing protein n=1 Tax=Aeromonas enteropelogenes TaxID=29489 RepID=UPI003BA1A044
MSAYGHTIGVFSDESAHLFASDFMRETSVLNSLWGAKPISAMRVSTQGATTIGDYRFSLSLMVQGPLFERFLDRQGEQARESGFFARCLLSEPHSTQGSRFFCDELSPGDVNATSLNDFYHTVEKLLKASQMRRELGKPRMCLTLSPEARARWFEASNYVENNIGPFGEWREYRDFASKFMEHASRIAAVLHCFTKRSPVISDVSMHAAIVIVNWYFQHFIEQFKERTVPNDIREANELERWLEINLHRSQNGAFKKNDIRKFGPNCIRNKVKLERALNALVNRMAVTQHQFNGTSYVNYYLPGQRRALV